MKKHVYLVIVKFYFHISYLTTYYIYNFKTSWKRLKTPQYNFWYVIITSSCISKWSFTWTNIVSERNQNRLKLGIYVDEKIRSQQGISTEKSSRHLIICRSREGKKRNFFIDRHGYICIGSSQILIFLKYIRNRVMRVII